MDISIWGVYRNVLISPTWQNIWKWCHCLPGGKNLTPKKIIHIWVFWRATELKFWIKADYPHIYYWHLYWCHCGYLQFLWFRRGPLKLAPSTCLPKNYDFSFNVVRLSFISLDFSLSPSLSMICDNRKEKWQSLVINA